MSNFFKYNKSTKTTSNDLIFLLLALNMELPVDQVFTNKKICYPYTSMIPSKFKHCYCI